MLPNIISWTIIVNSFSHYCNIFVMDYNCKIWPYFSDILEKKTVPYT